MSETHEFEAAEDAVVAALEPLKASGLLTLSTYAGELEVDDVAEITKRFPCIYVIAGGLTNKVVNRYDDAAVEILLIVGDKNLRSPQAAARGDAAGIGVYGLLALARRKLHRKPLLPGFAPLRVTAEQPLAYDSKRRICLYQATYRAEAPVNRTSQ